MWKRITNPDILIYLDVSWDVAAQRRRMDAKGAWWAELARRLLHARQHADLYIDTDDLTLPEVVDTTLSFLERHAARQGDLAT